MTMYRKKPIEVEAERFSKEKGHPHIRRCVIAAGKVECLLNDSERFHGGGVRKDAGRYESCAIKTSNGWVEIRDGDWIIKEMIEQGFYPCPNEVFIRTYEACV